MCNMDAWVNIYGDDYLNAVETLLDGVYQLEVIMNNAMPYHTIGRFDITVNMDTDLFISKVREILNKMAPYMANCINLARTLRDDMTRDSFSDTYRDYCNHLSADLLSMLDTAGRSILNMNRALSIVEHSRE